MAAMPTGEGYETEEVETPKFVNTYNATGQVVLRAWEDFLKGRDLVDDEFEFVLLDSEGNPLYKIDPETGEQMLDSETGEPIPYTAKSLAWYDYV